MMLRAFLVLSVLTFTKSVFAARMDLKQMAQLDRELQEADASKAIHSQNADSKEHGSTGAIKDVSKKTDQVVEAKRQKVTGRAQVTFNDFYEIVREINHRYPFLFFGNSNPVGAPDEVFYSMFNVNTTSKSWGDRIANRWNKQKLADAQSEQEAYLRTIRTSEMIYLTKRWFIEKVYRIYDTDDQDTGGRALRAFGPGTQYDIVNLGLYRALKDDEFVKAVDNVIDETNCDIDEEEEDMGCSFSDGLWLRFLRVGLDKIAPQ